MHQNTPQINAATHSKLFEIKIFHQTETYFLSMYNEHFTEAHMTSSSRDSIVDIATNLRAGQSGF
jgi:hypothetical protein